MKRSLYKMLILFIAALDICLPQGKPVLPPAPIMSDQGQIEVIIKIMDQALQDKNLSTFRTLFSQTKEISNSDETLLFADDVKSLKITRRDF